MTKTSFDKIALFESTKALWPALVDLRDPDATNKIYWAHEASAPVDDHWRQLALWSYHQALGELEKQALAQGLFQVAPRDVPFALFDKWMRFNLSTPEWSPERAQYEQANQSS